MIAEIAAYLGNCGEASKYDHFSQISGEAAGGEATCYLSDDCNILNSRCWESWESF